MYDFSKATDAEKFFNNIISALNGSKIIGVYTLSPSWFKRDSFVYEQDRPVYIIFDNGYCLVIEYYFINTLAVEYRKLTDAELCDYNESYIKDLFNRTAKVRDGRSHEITHIEKSELPYDSLERVELKRATEEYSAWIAGNIVYGIKPTEETFNEIKFVMKNGKSFAVCADDAESDGYSLLWSEDADIEEKPI